MYYVFKLRMVFCLFVLLLASMAVVGCATGRAAPPLKTETKLDLLRYMGKWYSIASIPQWFEKGCTCTTAAYSLRDDGNVTVVNSCMREGELDSVKGMARKRFEGDPSRLEVTFMRPFWGEYTVIWVDAAYKHALVGSRDRDTLWLLSRTPAIDTQTRNTFERIAKEQGFDVSRLEDVDQSCW